MFGVPVKGMPAEVRRRAKAIISHHLRHLGVRLAISWPIPREEAGAYIKKLFRAPSPGIRD